MKGKNKPDNTKDETPFLKKHRIRKEVRQVVNSVMSEMKAQSDLLNDTLMSYGEDQQIASKILIAEIQVHAELLAKGDLILLTRSTGEVFLREVKETEPAEDSPKKETPQVETPVSTQKSLENFKKIYPTLQSRGGSPIAIDTVEGAEMVCLSNNYFRSQWVGSTTPLEDIRIPYTDYITYIKSRATLLDNYPSNWEETLIQNLMWEAWIFCEYDGVLYTKPFSRGIEGWNPNDPIHPAISDSQDLDLRYWAKPKGD